MDITQSRILANNKGVVISGLYTGNRLYRMRYKTSKGEYKILTFRWGEQQHSYGTSFFGHVDDEKNELLVLSSEPFPY